MVGSMDESEVDRVGVSFGFGRLGVEFRVISHAFSDDGEGILAVSTDLLQ